MSIIQPVILAGGVGTRLWPLSRRNYPKQIQALLGQDSMLQATVARFDEPPIIVTQAEHRFIIQEQLSEIDKSPAALILEPVGKNTLPAACLAALHCQASPEMIMVMCPADHYIQADAFQDTLLRAIQVAAEGYITTLGITPTEPETGYGYIKMGSCINRENDGFQVISFTEKPNDETAKAYLASKQYFWNSGIYIFRVQTLLDEIKNLQPKIYEVCQRAIEQARHDAPFVSIPEQVFNESPSLSIDYGIMEQTAHGAMVRARFTWSDIGNWQALWMVAEKDKDQNVLRGKVLAKDTHNSYVRAESRTVATLGIENAIVIETPDAVLVADKTRGEEVKHLVDDLKKQNHHLTENHKRHFRPWGYFENLDQGAKFRVKRLMVKPGGRLSLQKHHHRAEHWVVVAGEALVTCGDTLQRLGPNESTYIPKETIHRLENPGTELLHVIEVQSGDYLEEDDIIRFEDDYNRIGVSRTEGV